MPSQNFVLSLKKAMVVLLKIYAVHLRIVYSRDSHKSGYGAE